MNRTLFISTAFSMHTCSTNTYEFYDETYLQKTLRSFSLLLSHPRSHILSKRRINT